MDKKVCIKCGEEKELSKENFIWRKTFWEGTCRVCQNEARRKRKPIKTKEGIQNINTRPKHERNYIMLNQEEIKIVKEIIKTYPDLKKLLDNKIELTKSNNKRVRKTITIDEDLNNKIEEKIKESNLNYSDIVNTLIRKSMEYFF